MASPNSSKTPQLLDDKMDDEDDSLLLDNEGNIKSAQPDPDVATDSPEKPVKTPGIRLTTENFRIVREQSDPVRTLISTRDSIRNFSDTNLRLYGQSIRPRWLGRPISPPILPGNISLPTDFHNDWRGIVQKYETKLHKKIVKVLPNLLDSLDAEIATARTTNLALVKDLVQETSPGQKRRGEAIFLRLCTRTKRVPPMGSRRTPPTQRRTDSSSSR